MNPNLPESYNDYKLKTGLTRAITSLSPTDTYNTKAVVKLSGTLKNPTAFVP